MEFFENINKNYAGVLSLVVSIITAIITAVYVVFTYKQMQAAQTSIDLMRKQMALDKQPCIIPEIIGASSAPVLSNGRRFLDIDINLQNTGSFSAISVITIGYFKLQQIKTKEDSNTVNMFGTPFYLPQIMLGSSNKAHIYFENKEIKYLIKDLTTVHYKNSERIQKDPTQNYFRGTLLIIKTYYRNILDQWFESQLSQEISWIIDNNAPERKTGNLNENTIPPRKLTPKMDVKLQFGFLNASPVNIRPVTEQYVTDQLEKYKERSPELFEALNNDS